MSTPGIRSGIKQWPEMWEWMPCLSHRRRKCIRSVFPPMWKWRADVKFVSWRDFGSTHGGEEKAALAELPKRFKELGVDAVISGMAC